ncbi:MAG TPA: response regulator [Thermoanaerobaculia bacterium]|nr:response regulator [Thermoanaerobaculia bacterium]
MSGGAEKGGAGVAGVLIVDDEEPARSILREHLEGLPGVRVVGECANGFDALKSAVELSPQIVFLDIEMPKLDGFEVLELLDPAIAPVFVTAYDEYAVRAFEVHAVDYVLKPFDPSRIALAVGRARERIARGPAMRAGELHAAARPGGAFLARVVVRDGSRVHIIPVERLDAIEAQDDYVGLKSGGKTYLKPQTLSSLAEALDPGRFVRVHRSHLVRLDAIARLEALAGGSHVAILADGTRVPVSREGYTRLKDLLC